jgi:hypothetical protein
MKASMAAIADGLVADLRDFVARAKAPLVAEIAVLKTESATKSDVECLRSENVMLRAELADIKARIAAVETRGVRFRGVWQGAEDYARGDLATHSGGLWHCNLATRDRPGTSPAWTLSQKSR